MHRPFLSFHRMVGVLLIATAAFAVGCGNGATASSNAADAGSDSADDTLGEIDTQIVKIPTITVKLDVAPQAGNAPLDTLFTATIEGVEKTEVFVTWDFGDGLDETYDLSTPEGANGDVVHHTYNSKGAYSVKVTVA